MVAVMVRAKRMFGGLGEAAGMVTLGRVRLCCSRSSLKTPYEKWTLIAWNSPF